jgi:hypothetical protein
LLRGKGEKEEDAVDQMAEDVSSTAKLCKWISYLDFFELCTVPCLDKKFPVAVWHKYSSPSLMYHYLTYPEPVQSSLSRSILISSPSRRRWAGMAQWYSAEQGAGWSGVRVLAGAGTFSLHHRVQTETGAPPSLLSNGF